MFFSRSSIRFVFVSAVGLTAACSGALDANLNTPAEGDGGLGSDGASRGDGAAGGGACVADSDCGAGKMCGFRVTDACGAIGACFDAPAPNTANCHAYNPGCACNGSVVNLACNGYPAGYASRPVRHQGTCATAVDAGATACKTDKDCAGGDLCEFRIADACSAAGVCFTPPPPGPTCAAYSPACTCDAQTINVVCTRYSSGYASKPVAHSGACAVASDDAGGNGGTFACDTGTCNETQVCEIGSGGAFPGTTTASCVDFPAPCASTRTCACVKQALGAQMCSETGGDLTVNFLYP